MNRYTISDILSTGVKPRDIGFIVDGAVMGSIVSKDELIFTIQRYGERVYITPADSLQAAADSFVAAWDMFNNYHLEQFNSVYGAMHEQYKPLDNYAMTETSTDSRTTGATHQSEKSGQTTDTLTRTGTITNAAENSDTSERTDNLTDTTTRTGTVQTVGKDTGKTADTRTVNTTNTGTQTSEITDNTTNSVAAYDVETFSNRDKQSKQGSDTRTDNLTANTTNGGEVNTTADTTSTVTNNLTDTTKNTGTQTTTNSGTATNTQTNNTTDTTSNNSSETISGTTSGTDNTEHTLTRTGNIGVTTSQQMLSAEIALRLKNQLAYYAVELFVSQYTTW